MVSGLIKLATIKLTISLGYDAFIPHFKPETFVLKYLGTLIFVINVCWWKIRNKTTFWRLTDIDLVTGRRE